MAALSVEVDEATDATYVTVSGASVASSREISELISVDLDAQGNPVGVEFVGGLRGSGSVAALLRAYPSLFDRLTRDGLLPTSRVAALRFTQSTLAPTTSGGEKVTRRVRKVRDGRVLVS